MKRIVIMLLIACSAITTISAESSAAPQKKAKSVIQSLEGIIAFHAKEGSQTLSVTKNPETGLIESSERIAPFTCEKETCGPYPSVSAMMSLCRISTCTCCQATQNYST